MVYTASVVAQALLEMLVHADATILSLSYGLIPARFDDKHMTALDRVMLAADWADDTRVTRRVGDAWAKAAASVALAVPSAILNTDDNCLLNPAHADRRRVAVGTPEPLVIDERTRRSFATP